VANRARKVTPEIRFGVDGNKPGLGQTIKVASSPPLRVRCVFMVAFLLLPDKFWAADPKRSACGDRLVGQGVHNEISFLAKSAVWHAVGKLDRNGGMNSTASASGRFLFMNLCA